jgi:hypothetical protein
MKPFISKTLLFLSIAMLSVVIVVLAINAVMRFKSNFEIDKSVTRLILGHSHPECAYNDYLIHDTDNFAQSGESYFYTNIKTQELIKSNPHVKEVFIEFTNDQINYSKNNWIWEDAFLTEKYPKYSPFMSYEDHTLLLKGNTTGFFNTLAISANKNIYNIINNKTDFTAFIGGYKALDHQLDTSERNKASSKNQLQISADSISTTNLFYLKKLVDFCQAQELKVYLVRSPLNKNNADLKNERLFQSLRGHYFKDIDFLDFADFPLEDSDFADLEHLNAQGATKFSTWFNLQLQEGFVDRSYDHEQKIN